MGVSRGGSTLPRGERADRTSRGSRLSVSEQFRRLIVAPSSLQMGDAKRRSEVNGCLTQPSYRERNVTREFLPRSGAGLQLRQSDSQCLMKIAALCCRLASVLQSATCQTLRTGSDHRRTTLDSTRTIRSSISLSRTIEPRHSAREWLFLGVLQQSATPRSRLQQHANIVINAGKGPSRGMSQRAPVQIARSTQRLIGTRPIELPILVADERSALADAIQ